jgi:chromosome segregation ATPase
LLAKSQKALDDLKSDHEVRAAQLTLEKQEALRKSAEKDAKMAEKERAVAQISAELKQFREEFEELKKTLQTEKEAHDADSAAFAREFRSALRQRDEAITELEAERGEHRHQVSALQEEHSEHVRVHTEQKEQTESEMARLRRDRDSFARERDELRKRVSRLFDQQREALGGLMEGSAPLASAAPAPRREPVRPYVPPPVEAPVVVPAPTRSSGPRPTPVEVIEAELVAHEEENGEPKNFHLPPVRPMSVTPPSIRALG